MPASGTAKLYTPEILGLAVELAQYPLTEDLPLRGSARSRSCGSSLTIALAVSEHDAVSKCGMQVTACAVGQAAAAIFARQVIGRTHAQLSADGDAVAAWLEGAEERPNWPGLELLDEARAFPARHGAILLPWKAALDALSKAGAES